MANTYIRVNIAGGGGGTDDRRVKVSIDDAAAGFLEDKIVVGSSKLTLNTNNPGASEEFEIDVDQTQIDHDQLLNFEVDEHRPLDDLATTTTSLWSSQKIQDELDGKINAATPIVDNTLIKSVGTSGVDVEATGIVVDDSDNVTGINNLTIDGDLTVNGTTTSVNSTTLDVTDANITVNNGGTQASADSQDAGITVEMSDATNAAIGYDSTTTSKFALGEVGDLREVATISHAQTLSNKTIDADNNTLTNLETDNLKAGVLETDLNNVVDNTNLAGAQAIKDYVAQEIATVDEASEISYSNLSSGLTATNVQDAIDEVEGRLDTAETTLSNHLNTNPGKHNADQINYDNSTSGLTATDVQAAVDELETEKFNSADFDSSFDTRLATKTTTDLAEGVNLYFTDERAQDAVGSILTDSASVDFTYDDAGNSITADVLPAGVDHDQLNNFVTNEHIDHSTINIDAGEGLTGGGDLTATRELALDVPSLTLSGSVDSTNDDLLIYDADQAEHRRIKVSQISTIGTSAGDLSEGSSSLVQTASAQSVTGFAFANGTVRSFKAQVAVEISATADLYEEFTIEAIQRGADWQCSVSSTGDDTDVTFDVNTSGQVIYDSGSYAGFTSGTIKFRAQTLTV